MAEKKIAGKGKASGEMQRYEPHKVEKQVIEFWEKNRIYPKAMERVRQGKPFYFLDGPPFPSGETHPGTAANKVSKDFFIRYKRMRGFNVRDQPGWDMHGLPIEQKTEQLLGLKDKRDIARIGIKKFIDECKKYAVKHMGLMERDFMRLGVWMTWENAYRTITPEYMESVWYALKCTHDRKLLYKGKKALSWCPRCATVLAKNELTYRTVEDNSMFVKMPVEGKDKEYLIIWTTTPWTIPFNMAIMANPELDYLRFKVGDEVWIMAKTLVDMFMGAVVGKKYEPLDTIRGEKLIGTRYRHPFYEEMPYHQKKKNAYFVVGSTQFVSATAGSGLVHCAPGCGPEDFQVGLENGIPIFNEVDENGYLAGESGEFKGWKAKDDDQKFVDLLREKGLLVAQTPVEHEYAHCWRCDSPIIYRATDQWFIAISKIRDEILDEIRGLYTVPAEAKDIFLDWIANFSDWCITLQRFWNIPAPIWHCDSCEHYEIFGRIAELEKRAKVTLKDIHRPDVDPLTWKCPDCGGTMRRISDVLSGWLDSGAAPWASLEYPQRTDLFKQYFPSDFVMEGRDQIRAWFSAMMNFSMAAFGKRPYNAVYWHGFFNDSEGHKMSKSKGNFIAVQEICDKMGGDPTRMKFIEWIAPGQDVRFSMKEIEENVRALNVLWNMHSLIIKSSRAAGVNPSKLTIERGKLDFTDRWLLSSYHALVKTVTEKFEAFLLSEIPPLLRRFWLDDLSRWYIQNKRSAIAVGDKATLAVLSHVYLSLLRLSAPMVPLTSEAIYQGLKSEFGLEGESVHLQEWVAPEGQFIDDDVMKAMDILRTVTTNVLGARRKVSRGVRWPLRAVDVITRDKRVIATLAGHAGLVKTLANAWELNVKGHEDSIVRVVKPDFAKIGPKHKGLAAKLSKAIGEADAEQVTKELDKKGSFTVKVDGHDVVVEKGEVLVEETLPKTIYSVPGTRFSIYVHLEETPEMLASGLAREMVRHVQELRKEAGLLKRDRIELVVVVGTELQKRLKPHEKEIASTVGAKAFRFADTAPSGYQHTAKATVRGSQFEIFFKKV